ncbi:quinolinate synthase NadA [Candidatus Sumerlaeota bacterium]|nr:quinolinate synthase NadA [Candidatus Sumerlaeales bacterium]NLD61742.1 quinolinate synthase NadA [Candidatus Sumerlaeota bacterium]
MESKQEQIRHLVKEHNAIIVAHYYEPDDIQAIADHLGDSLALCLEAQKTTADIIIFCGVHFMAESAKILNPSKTVMLPVPSARCLMADTISAKSLSAWRAQQPEGAPIVTYVNSTAEVKALSDICCTSANAASVVRSLPDKTVLFTPDRNLAHWVQTKVPEKNIIAYDGACPIHDILRAADVQSILAKHPDAMLLAHPECRDEVLRLAHMVTSTSGMFKAVGMHPEIKTFVLATESGILYLMHKQYPDKNFIIADADNGQRMRCPYMKETTLDSILSCFAHPELHTVDVAPEIAQNARRALERMMTVPRD